MWLPIPEWEDLYEVSDEGQVRSLDRTTHFIDGRVRQFQGKVLAPIPRGSGGHLWVTLTRGPLHRPALIHRLMLEAFVGPAPDEKAEGRHLNDISTDNRLVNLAWGTRSDNQQDAVRNQRNAQSRKTHCPQGHPYLGDNVRIDAFNGGRRCVLCTRKGGRAATAKSRAKAQPLSVTIPPLDGMMGLETPV